MRRVGAASPEPKRPDRRWFNRWNLQRHYGTEFSENWSTPARFAGWARSAGIDSRKVIWRIDDQKPLGPDNCEFVTRREWGRRQQRRMAEWNRERTT